MLHSALSITIQFTIHRISALCSCPCPCPYAGSVSVRLSAAIAVDGFDFIRGCTFLVAPAAWHLSPSSPPLAAWVRVHPLYMFWLRIWLQLRLQLALACSSSSCCCPSCCCPFMRCVHCCCVLLLLIFLSALLFIATEKCLPTTQGKLDCNFYWEDKFYSPARTPFPLHTPLYCVGQVIMWAVWDVAADGIRSTLHLATKLLANGQCGVCVILTRLTRSWKGPLAKSEWNLRHM